MNMVNEILYATAIDKDGNLIHIDDAVKGIDYYCPECKKEFILHKSGKTGQGSKRPHFKHNELSPNCKPETVLQKYCTKLTGKRTDAKCVCQREKHNHYTEYKSTNYHQETVQVEGN